MQGGPASSGGPRKGPGGPLTVADLLEGAQRAAAAAANTASPAAAEQSPSTAVSKTAAAAAAAAAEAEECPGLSLAIPSIESQGPLSGALVGPPSGAPSRRLMIERVVLEDFKSYNKKRVIGPFHKRFTAIVGPNGSGKSNVIDAMLFVFGRRAQQIRLRKVTELIHNSAAAAAAAADDSSRPKKRRPATGDPSAAAAASVAAAEEQQDAAPDAAETALVTAAAAAPAPAATAGAAPGAATDPESDGFEVVEGSRFVVCREVCRHSGGSTSFYVNGKRCQQRDVVSLLKAKGLDLQNNRFLILQGEVEQIAMMRPKASVRQMLPGRCCRSCCCCAAGAGAAAVAAVAAVASRVLACGDLRLPSGVVVLLLFAAIGAAVAAAAAVAAIGGAAAAGAAAATRAAAGADSRIGDAAAAAAAVVGINHRCACCCCPRKSCCCCLLHAPLEASLPTTIAHVLLLLLLLLLLQYQEKANRMRCAAAELRRLEGPKDEALASLKTNREAAAAKVILAAVYRRVFAAAAAAMSAAAAVKAAAAAAAFSAAEERHIEGEETEEKLSAAAALAAAAISAAADKRRIESEETEEKLRETQQKHKAAEEKLEGLKAALQKIEEDTAAQAEQLKAAEADCAGADSALQKLVRQDDELRAELKGELTRLEEKKQQLQQLESRQEQQQQRLQQLEASLQQRDAGQDACKVREAEETVEKAKAAVQNYTESIKGEIKRLGDDHAAAEKLLLQQQQQLDKHLTETAKLTSALELLERKERQLVERQQQMQAALKRLVEGETANAAALQQQQQQQAAAAAELASLRRQKEDTTQIIARLENDIINAKGQLKRAEQQRQETRCSSRLVSLLAQEKRQQRLKGLLDRLGELASIDKKYEKAFLAASGGFSAFYVVEDPADARELFALLRQHELGRCNVLALRVLERELNQRMQDADVEASRWKDTASPRLLDLLQFSSPRIRVAFFKAVGSTRVATDIEHATHIAYNLRQRAVVTLDGGLIELDGRLVGGGIGFGGCSIRTDGLQRRAALAVSSEGDTGDQQQQLQQLQQTISLTQNQLKEARHRKEQLEETEKHLERQRGEAEAAIELLQQNISSADLQKKELRRRVEAAKGDSLSKKETAQLQDLKASVASAAEAQKSLHEAVKHQETIVSQLLEKLQNAGGDKMQKLRRQLLHAERRFSVYF
ncbi:hypothetical protein ACSSS7_000076 [Eimeria intestinalis]